jgi:hypothetical protein
MHTAPGLIGSHVPPPDELELLDELDELDELELLDELDELDELELLDELDELELLDELDPDELDAPPELDDEFPDPASPLEEDDTAPPPSPDELLLAPLPPPVSPSSVSTGPPSKVDPSAQCKRNNDVRPKIRGSAIFFTIDDRTCESADRKRKRANSCSPLTCLFVAILQPHCKLRWFGREADKPILPSC